MNIYILTLFPEAVYRGLLCGVIKRAADKKIINIECVNIRDFAGNKHLSVDDSPYGGGAGMIMSAQPVYDAYLNVKNKVPEGVKVIYLTPQGRAFNQKTAAELSGEKNLILLCGRYEGIDERVIEEIVTDEISIGDYILTGGEIPAMALADAVCRLVPGVLGGEDSHASESFYTDALEYPQYTRPEEWRGKRVPEVLLSGHHGNIKTWREGLSAARTIIRRPDLLKRGSVMTSKERIRNVISGKDKKTVPCAVNGILHGTAGFLGKRFKNAFDEADFLLTLGLDTAVHLNIENVSHEKIKINYRTETITGERDPIWTKIYETPDGNLEQSVRKNHNYRHNEIPLFSDDHVPPAKSYKHLVEKRKDLKALRALLKVPGRNELEEEYRFAQEAKDYCEKRGVLLAGSLQGIGDPLLWLSGVSNTLISAMEEPEFIYEYVEILSDWNIETMNRLIDIGAEYILRRGWYESADFWSPALYKKFLLGPLKRETELAKNAGVVYSYIMNSGVTPLINEIAESGIDALTNVEPEKNDMELIKEKLVDITLITGVNNYHVIEEGTEEDVEAAVNDAIKKLSRGGKFILAPSDSINFTGDKNKKETSKINFYKMVEVWKSYNRS